VDHLRERFGNLCIRRAILLEDPSLTGVDADAGEPHPGGFPGKGAIP
jgi:hypothetical protein